MFHFILDENYMLDMGYKSIKYASSFPATDKRLKHSRLIPFASQMKICHLWQQAPAIRGQTLGHNTEWRELI